jgi:hypothetical protein
MKDEHKNQLPTAKGQKAPSQSDIAAKAMELKRQGQKRAEHLDHQTDTPGDGPLGSRNAHEPVMGAFEAEGHRPVVERSRKVR